MDKDIAIKLTIGYEDDFKGFKTYVRSLLKNTRDNIVESWIKRVEERYHKLKEVKKTDDTAVPDI